MQRRYAVKLAVGFWLVCALCWPLQRAYAIFGAADTTVIIGDLTDEIKWPRELVQWTQLIESTREEIQKTDELIKLAGDPEKVMGQLIESVPDLMKPIDEAVGLENRKDALRAAQSLYGLKKVAVQTYRDINKVDNAYEAFGEKFKRDQSRYIHFAMQEAMYARYKRAVESQEDVDKQEAKVLKDALAALKTAKTTTEIEGLKAKMAASQQRQDLAHQKAEQAKGELDAFNGQLLVEDARKVEADREWAQTVVDRMREKALAAYQAQMGLEADGGGTE